MTVNEIKKEIDRIINEINKLQRIEYHTFNSDDLESVDWVKLRKIIRNRIALEEELKRLEKKLNKKEEEKNIYILIIEK